MKLAEKYEWSDYADGYQEYDIAEAVAKDCRSRYEDNIDADKIAEKLAALVALLHENGHLSDNNVLSLLTRFERAPDLRLMEDRK
jgi:hypothetical protein